MSSARAVRRGLLFGRRVGRRRDGERADLAGEFLGVEPGAGGNPVFGRQLELPILGPVGEDAEQVAKVRLGVEPVQPAGGDEREQVSGTLPVVVAADKEPGLASGRDGAAQGTLAPVVVEQKPAVVEDAHQRLLLPDGVAESGAQEAALVSDRLVLDGGPCKERLGVGPQVNVAQSLDVVGRLVTPGGIELEDAAYARETLSSGRTLGQSGLPEFAALDSGDAVAANSITQMVDPWPANSGDKNIAFDGQKMQAAVERYRTGKVIQPTDPDNLQSTNQSGQTINQTTVNAGGGAPPAVSTPAQ